MSAASVGAAYHPDDVAYPDRSLLIGDRRLEGSHRHAHVYPGTGRATGDVAMAGAAEMDAAVAAAREALPGWKNAPANLRRNWLLKLADLIDRHDTDLARLVVAENGTTIAKAGIYCYAAADNFRYYAGWVDKIGGQVLPSWPIAGLDYTRFEPFGVVAVIIPWNVPLAAFSSTVGGALAAGNTVVVKPSELAPLTSLRLGELCLEAGFPPGVVNVVPGGPEGGEALVRHRGVDKVHFTGSGATAERIIASIGLKPIGLELGGKSARIVFADADVEAAAAAAVSSVLSNSGQGCLLGTRLLAEASIYDELVERCRTLMESNVVGDPFDQSSHVGPVISETARERILSVVERARVGGEGRLVTGGKAREGEGFYLEPTMFADVDNGCRLAQEEVFGPVLAVNRFEGDEQAVDMANDSPFGLGAYLHGSDYRRLHRAAAGLEVGNVWVNGYNMPASAPFGGAKQSGYGRVGGEAGLQEFLRVKNVWMAL